MNRMRMQNSGAAALLVWAVAAAAVAGSNPPAKGFDETGSDARAMELADRTMEAMGGRANWDAVQTIGWTIFGRTHLWNKWTGQYRLDADTLTVVMNLNTGAGRAWSKGREVTSPDSVAPILRDANSIWINDAYWLVMPYKLKDTGVTLRYAGEKATEDGRAAERLVLTFKGVGDTPDNKYDVFVDRESGLVTQWCYYKLAADSIPRFTLPWTNWTSFGAVKLATGRGKVDVTGIRVSAADEHESFEKR
jgi:hypothetical protein